MTNDLENGLRCAAAAIRIKRDVHGRDFADYKKYEDVLRRLCLKRQDIVGRQSRMDVDEI
jgi:hypothetical protein